MKRFLLIHGSAHGAWCWDKLIPHLTAEGHVAIAIDLPSHGLDQTPASQVTLDSYANAIQAAITMPTNIVAHSMSGFPATLAAYRAFDQVTQLIYLCAHVPEPGKSIADMRALAETQPLATVMIPSEDGITLTIDPTQAHEKFYHDVRPELSDWARSQLCPQPLLPQKTPFPQTAAPDIARHYIRCMQDRAIPPAYQIARTASWPADTVSSLSTSHSPFLSAPGVLARLLINIAER